MTRLYWVLLVCARFYCVLLCFTGLNRVLPSRNEFKWISRLRHLRPWCTVVTVHRPLWSRAVPPLADPFPLFAGAGRTATSVHLFMSVAFCCSSPLLGASRRDRIVSSSLSIFVVCPSRLDSAFPVSASRFLKYSPLAMVGSRIFDYVRLDGRRLS